MPNPFEYHRPSEEQIPRIEAVRAAYFQALETVLDQTRPGSVSGRYLALAKTAMEESAMWATKAIVFEADNQPEHR
jgi:hypothetical protein